MTVAAVKPLPRRRDELVVRPSGTEGEYVVKVPSSGGYFHIGSAEHFLLDRLDGQQSAESICEAYQKQFAEPLSQADLEEFLVMADRMGMLETGAEGSAASAGWSGPVKPRQSILYFRRSLFDPDSLFNWLEPRLRFFWTRGFVILSLVSMALAALITWEARDAMLSRFATILSWKVLALFWVTVIITMMLHEFAHGLTCKHFGGEVRELGVLMMFFSPCLYCNVSDAWLFPEKSKRLWIGAAGPFLDLCLWAAATFVWRLTIEDTALNYVAWTVMATCGTRTVLNFNPLMRSDGYYLLSDALALPNLSVIGWLRWLATLRWILWGAPRPAAIPHGRFIVSYGMASWLFTFLFLGVMALGLARFGSLMGTAALGLSLSVFGVMVLVVFRGVFYGEVRKMIKERRKQRMVWVAGLGLLPVVLAAAHINDRVSGPSQVRPAARIEVRSPEAGFLAGVKIEEGSRVSPGEVLARIHVPDLDSNLAKKRAEVRECQAGLRRLEAGPRREEVLEQRQRVSRAEAWRDLGRQDLERSQVGLQEDLRRLDLQIAQYAQEMEYAKKTVDYGEKLFQQNAMSGQQFLAEKKNYQIAQSQWEQAKAQKRSREAAGVLQAEAELAKREKELADVRAALTLLEAGSRPEEIDAERARLARLQEELKYLEGVQERVVLRSPGAGLITTPRMKEKNGHYFEKGAVVCVVEDVSKPEVEISLNEEDEALVEPGQLVEVKARAMPFRTFRAHVDRKAPSAAMVQGQVQGTVTVYCRLEDADAGLLSGATGFARIYRGSRSLAVVLVERGLRYLRTEFWW